MKKLFVLLVFCLCIGIIFFFSQTKTTGRLIGVIVPLEHQALTEIVNGFKEELKAEPGISIQVLNAQGDMNIQRALIEQLKRDSCEIFVPIGTTASEMTMSLAKGQKIVCLATSLTPPQQDHELTCLSDELSPADSLYLLKTAYPEMKKFTLVHSASEKVMKEIPSIQEAAEQQNMKVQTLMIYTLPELYTAGHAIAEDSEAIFVLKDHLIVSGIQTLAKQAEKRNIPVITSDEGSVAMGGAFAIGVKEAEIGKQGGQIVKMVLDGAIPREIKHRSIKGPFPLFINRSSCKNQKVDVERLVSAAEKFGNPVQYTE